MIIDLRSDTVTKPTQGMLEAMWKAEVGDDVLDEDHTIKKLESKLAEMFNMEAGLFCPSGTMTNQIAIRLFTEPQSEVICDKLSHIHNYEGGGIAYNSLATTKLLNGSRGILSAEDILENIQPDNIHFPKTTLVAIENTVNKGGGSYYTLNQIGEISKVCRKNGLKLHLDGARIFNALIETKDKPSDYGQYFDGISICLSKGLGAPVGSVLLTNEQNIRKAKRIRKVLGGGWRQAGYLAAAGIYALDHHIDRLKEDHSKAKEIESILLNYADAEVMPVLTNIVIAEFPNEQQTLNFVNYLKQKQIFISHFSKNTIRMVTHLQFEQNMLEVLIETIKGYKQGSTSEN